MADLRVMKIRMSDTEPFDVEYDEQYQKRFPDFEDFVKNFKVGWNTKPDSDDLLGDPTTEYSLDDGKTWLCAEEFCKGHVASDDDSKVCGRCRVHIDSLRPE